MVVPLFECSVYNSTNKQVNVVAVKSYFSTHQHINHVISKTAWRLSSVPNYRSANKLHRQQHFVDILTKAILVWDRRQAKATLFGLGVRHRSITEIDARYVIVERGEHRLPPSALIATTLANR